MTQDITAVAEQGGEEPGHAWDSDYDEFYKDAVPKLLITARRLAGPDSEDLVQEAMTTVFRRWSTVGTLRPGERYNYAKTTLVRLGLRAIEKDRALRRMLPRLWNRDDAEHVEREAVAAVSRIEALKLIDKLPRQQRTVLTLLCDGHPMAQVAEMMELTVSTVRSHLLLARATLGRELERLDGGNRVT